MRLRLAAATLLFFPGVWILRGGPLPSVDSKTFESAVKPFLSQNCQACHNPKLSSGGLDVSPFLSMSAKLAMEERDRLEKIADRLKAGEMPPPPMRPPDPSQLDRVTGWIDKTYSEIDKAAGPNAGRVTARRLNRSEYKNTLRDLLGVVPGTADDFPADESGYGFDNIGDVLSMSPLRTEKYLKAAREAARTAIVVPQGSVPSTVEHYTAEQLKQVRRLDLNFDHYFPVDGEYTLRATFYQALRDKTKFHGQILFDGKPVSETPLEFYYNMDRAFEARNLLVRAGTHRIQANIKMEPGYKGALPYLDSLDVRGPVRQVAPELTSSHRKVISCGHGFGTHNASCMRRVLTPFLQRAYRRPVSAPEVNRLIAVAQTAVDQGESFEQGIRLAVEAALVSPKFLFRMEKDASRPGSFRISDHELASRLSYFIWSSMPDDELLALADAGKLHSPAVLVAQTKRLIADKRSDALVENFGGQWLQLRNLETAKPDIARFPDFDNELRAAMRQETEMFLQALLRENRSVLELLDGKFTFLNERLAKHYGVAGVQGPEFRRYEWDGVQRSGILTQASVLTVSSYPTRTSPVLRGKWVLENLLNAPPPPPPPDVPGLDEKTEGSAGTLRQQLEKHRASPVCSSCHARMDPLGFGLENYDAIGRWRATEGELPLDTSGLMPNGKSFATPAELKQILRADKTAFARAFTEKLMTYALGRGLERFDRPEVTRIVNAAAASKYRISDLMMGIVKSSPFRMRQGEKI